jgi:hypothetical protein
MQSLKKTQSLEQELNNNVETVPKAAKLENEDEEPISPASRRLPLSGDCAAFPRLQG